MRSKSKPAKPAARSDASLVDALAQTAFVVTSVLTRIGAKYDLSLTQMRTLGILRDRRLRMAQLSDFMGLDRSTLTGLVDRAEARGLLARESNPDDGRAVDVVMTTSGQALAVEVHAEVTAELAAMTSRLGADERRTLTRLLETLLAHAT